MPVDRPGNPGERAQTCRLEAHCSPAGAGPYRRRRRRRVRRPRDGSGDGPRGGGHPDRAPRTTPRERLQRRRPCARARRRRPTADGQPGRRRPGRSGVAVGVGTTAGPAPVCTSVTDSRTAATRTLLDSEDDAANVTTSGIRAEAPGASSGPCQLVPPGTGVPSMLSERSPAKVPGVTPRSSATSRSTRAGSPELLRTQSAEEMTSPGTTAAGEEKSMPGSAADQDVPSSDSSSRSTASAGPAGPTTRPRRPARRPPRTRPARASSVSPGQERDADDGPGQDDERDDDSRRGARADGDRRRLERRRQAARRRRPDVGGHGTDRSLADLVGASGAGRGPAHRRRRARPRRG